MSYRFYYISYVHCILYITYTHYIYVYIHIIYFIIYNRLSLYIILYITRIHSHKYLVIPAVGKALPLCFKEKPIPSSFALTNQPINPSSSQADPFKSRHPSRAAMGHHHRVFKLFYSRRIRVLHKVSRSGLDWEG